MLCIFHHKSKTKPNKTPDSTPAKALYKIGLMTVFWKKNSLLENIPLLVIKCEDGARTVYVCDI